MAWAALLARVFAIDITTCRTCGGSLRIHKAVTLPEEIALHLHGARAPPLPTPLGQLLLFA